MKHPFARVIVEGKPQVKKRPRTAFFDKHGRQLAKPRTYTPAVSEAAESTIKYKLREQNPGLVPVDHSVSVVVYFQGVDATSDLDNLIKTVLDAANGEVFLDDRQVCKITADMMRGGDPLTDAMFFHYEEGDE